MSDIPIFIPSYHRAQNLKTVKYWCNLGWERSKIHVIIDSEADDKMDYEEACSQWRVRLQIFDMTEARQRYDYVHLPSPARRSAGQARNMFQDIAKQEGIDFYVVQDDDTNVMGIRASEGEVRAVLQDDDTNVMGIRASEGEVRAVFGEIEEMMRAKHIGVFGVPQCGDYIGGVKPWRFIPKVMNTTFYLLPYIYRGERGVQDDDTSLFCGIHNAGLFTGSTYGGLTLYQTESATQAGGLTDLYHECKLLNKAMVVPLQYPSAVCATKQKKNGGRLHHHITDKYIRPRVLRNEGGRDNIAWDTYPEDVPFTNEPKKKRTWR